jgi:aminoglycoside phosphotransferase (APT) family kinase protein
MSDSVLARADKKLPPEALKWVRDAVGSGTDIESYVALPGATSSSLHALNIKSASGRHELVLRRFTDCEWLSLEPDLALHEASNLGKAKSSSVPVPELIAFDETGSSCGAPAVLMTRLPGHVELLPRDLNQWLIGLAEAIAPLHCIDATDYRWKYFPYINHLTQLLPPAWSAHPKLWEHAISIVEKPPVVERQCFIHRDYHPNNVLWQDGTVTGIVDWVNSCEGVPAFDIAWCRLNLAQLCGVKAADNFLAAYTSVVGSSYEQPPYWDIMALIEVLPGPPRVYEGWSAFGVSELTHDLMRKRLDDYLVSIMTRCA